MKRIPPVVAAFTLIEMMIAVGLGSMIILVATAGFRTAANTVATANRLSLENSLLRSGYFEAQLQLDFWTNLDDPTKPDSDRPLKAPTSVGQITDWTGQGRPRGLPFTPMPLLQSNGIWPKAGSVPRFAPTTLPGGALGNFVVPRPASELSNLSWELDRGWDPSYSWAPHDPRTWTRANLAEKDRGDDGRGNDGPDNLPRVINGRYAIFANTNPSAQALKVYKLKPDRNNPDEAQKYKIQEVSYSGYPSPEIRSWYYNQLNALVDAMGYAAFCEYLPANAIYTWYSDRGDVTAGGINKFGITPDYNFTNWDGNQRNSRGIYRNTYSTSYGYINPRSWDDYRVNPPPTSGTPATGNNLRQRFYQHYDSDYNATDLDTGTGWNGGNDLRWFLSHVNFPEALMDVRPSAWPEVQVSVGRLIKNAHHVAVAKVRRFSPFTGEVIELSWCGLGTSLRGARQQRLPGTGWARWDNGSGAAIDNHLDTP
jgi:hypothetical protein